MQDAGPSADQIILSPMYPTTALLVPQEVLDTTPVEELPKSNFGLDRIRGTIQSAKKDSHGSRPSVPWRETHERWPLSEKVRKSFEQLIAA